MKKIIQKLSIVLFASLSMNVSAAEPLAEIKNFRILSTQFANAGMPTPEEFKLIHQQGYQHIINLIPGDFSHEQQQVTSLGMSFEQIAVDWHQPTLENFQQFVKLMQQYQKEKVLVHCQLNYRASAFSYLYQVTQLGVSTKLANNQMITVWQPEGTWLEFIDMVEQHYKKDNKLSS